MQVFKAKGEKVLMLFKDQNYDFKDISVYVGEIIYKNISDFFIAKELKYEPLLDFLQQEKITKIFLDVSIKLQFDGIDYCDIFLFSKRNFASFLVFWKKFRFRL